MRLTCKRCTRSFDSIKKVEWCTTCIRSQSTISKLYKDWNMKEKYKYYDMINGGYLDIESSGLTGDFDICLSYAIKTRNTQTGKLGLCYDVLRQEDFDYARKEHDADLIDKRLMGNLIKDIMGDTKKKIEPLDFLIGHWFIGKHRHDMPFIRTRCAINGVKGLPKHKQIRYGDTQKWGSLLYRLHSNGLESISDMFNIHIHKTRLKPKIWKNACIGIKKDLNYILDHNIKDVELTYKIHIGMEEYVPIANTYA